MRKYMFFVFVLLALLTSINYVSADCIYDPNTTWLTCDSVPTFPTSYATVPPQSSVSSGDTLNDPPRIISSVIPPNIKAAIPSADFSWSATDPENDNLLWGINWGDGDVSEADDICVENPPAGTKQNWAHTESHTWLNGGNYTVKVFVSDCRGNTTISTINLNVAGGFTATGTLGTLPTPTSTPPSEPPPSADLVCGGVVGTVLSTMQTYEWVQAAKAALVAASSGTAHDYTADPTQAMTPDAIAAKAAARAGWTRGQYIAYYVWRYAGKDLYFEWKQSYGPNGENYGSNEIGESVSLRVFINAGKTPPGSGCGYNSTQNPTSGVSVPGGVPGTVLDTAQTYEWVQAAKAALVAASSGTAHDYTADPTQAMTPDAIAAKAAARAGWTRAEYVAYYVWRYAGTDLYYQWKVSYGPDCKFCEDYGRNEIGESVSLRVFITSGNKISAAGVFVLSPKFVFSSFLYFGVEKDYPGVAIQINELQKVLNVPVTGKFDTTTLNAVKAFQAGHGLVVDGKVGPQTRAVLNSL